MPKRKILASGKRLQTRGKIVNAMRGGMLFDGGDDMKPEDKPYFLSGLHWQTDGF
jgi:hypothetical protein